MERVELAYEPHAERQRWRNGGEWDPAATKVAVGEMSDGRWYVRFYSLGAEWPACVYRGPHAEHYARGTARRWRRTFGGEWVEA